eukprot:2792409-Amphidinium_carterae.1
MALEKTKMPLFELSRSSSDQCIWFESQAVHCITPLAQEDSRDQDLITLPGTSFGENRLIERV